MEPLFSLIGNDTTTLANETFVVIMVDPDAPTPTNRSFSQVRHFVGGGYVLDNSTTNSTMLFNTTAALSEYLSPGPPAGSPPHRQVVKFVYVQPPDFNQTAPTLVNASTPILNFNLTTFAEAANLSDPIAGNFFLVGPDDSNSSSTAVSSSVLATSSMSSALLPVTSTNSGPITSTSLITTFASPTATNGGVMLNPLRGIKTALYVCIISVIGYYVI
ncbi:hypothetical protein AMATHDRAFT_142692 [Amanita thiersii Skay4041]|uniref:PEBP-like protein n=1 Tax=Amanita thiersii Skay4041 TaxID=703135 RepID=A0A2A9NUK1_9AGAR|nr:hypothetical protein AMATHDRAFT_142692 [Amanita thiersii Skay4041]